MNPKILNPTITIFTYLIFTTSCQKAGLGGDNVIVAFPAHHGTTVKTGTVYIKYNAKESPGINVSKYDSKVTIVNEAGEKPYAHFHDLEKGNYYLYCVGFDSTIMETVKGGIPIQLMGKVQELEVNLPVTE